MALQFDINSVLNICCVIPELVKENALIANLATTWILVILPDMEPWSAAAVAAPCSLASVYSLVGVQATSMLFTLFEGNVSFEIFGTFTVILKSNKKISIYQTKYLPVSN